jgi:hypothetical protein
MTYVLDLNVISNIKRTQFWSVKLKKGCLQDTGYSKLTL